MLPRIPFSGLFLLLRYSSTAAFTTGTSTIRLASSSAARHSITSRTMASFETEEKPVWDPIAQIYVGGKVPGADDATVRNMIEKAGALRVFGYGSLCWNPGKPGESALADSRVSSRTGHAKGYRRVWAQKSTDHRGLPSFPGIVCTLLRESEFAMFRDTAGSESMTEGVIYSVPLELVDECLAELDFREKGVSARSIITRRSFLVL